MTYIEKLRQDHPEWSEFEIGYKVADCCPEEFGYPENCDNDCKNCWYREFPEEDTDVEELQTALVKLDTTIEHPDPVGEPEPMGVPGETSEPHILDSGDRTQFESGAVRDMREGKGRCDLTPIDVMAHVINGTKDEEDPILTSIAQFQLDNDTEWLYQALNTFSRAYDSVETMILEVAKHFEEGAKKYGPDNWRKSIPIWCYIDSGVRHYLKWLRGDTDENHSAAFCWNLMCCIWEVDYGEEWRAATKKEET